MTYKEFKQYCSVKILPNGDKYHAARFKNELRAISYFINSLLRSKGEKEKIPELLEMINHLELKSDKDVIIKKEDFEFRLFEEKQKEEMLLLASKVLRNENGDLIINKEDYIYEIAYDFGIVGFLYLLEQSWWTHEHSFPSTKTTILLDDQLNNHLIIRKDKTAAVGWLPFPEVLVFETKDIEKYLRYWYRFLSEN